MVPVTLLRKNINISWREASDDDRCKLAEWNHDLIRDEGHRNPMTVAELMERMKAWQQSKYQAVIFSTDEPVGYALFRKGDDLVDLRHFFVRRDRRRVGVGSAAFAILRHKVWPKNVRLTVMV